MALYGAAGSAPLAYPPGTFLEFWVRWFASLSVVCVIYSCYLVEVPNRIWGYGAAGSAPAWHAGGQGFESPYLHVFSVEELVARFL